MNTLLLLTLLAVSYLLFVILSTNYKKVAIAFFVAAPILLSPYWISSDLYDVFSWLKLYSVLVFLWLSLIINFSSFANRYENVIKFSIYFLLQINILEAMLLDASKGHFTNVFLGVVLMATLSNWKDITLKSNTFLAINWSIPLPWIIGYTLWNWFFVHFQFSMLAGVHLVLLAGPLIGALFNRRMWLYYRSHSLGIHLIWIFTFPYQQFNLSTDFIWITAQQSMIAEIATGIILLAFFFKSYITNRAKSAEC